MSDTNIAIKRKRSDILKKPYSNCEVDLRTADINTVDSKLWRDAFQNKKIYTQNDCMRKAFRIEVSKKCNCIVEKIDRELGLNFPICKSAKCHRNVFSFDWKLNNFDGKYDKECPLECNIDWIEKKVYTRNFPSYAYAKLLKESKVIQHKSVNDISKSRAMIHIYYEKLGYYSTYETPLTLSFDLISKIGGMLGLFLGLSLLSLIEIFQYISIKFTTTLSKLKCKNKDHLSKKETILPKEQNINSIILLGYKKDDIKY